MKIITTEALVRVVTTDDGQAEVFAPNSLCDKVPELTPHVFAVPDKIFFSTNFDEHAIFTLTNFRTKRRGERRNGN